MSFYKMDSRLRIGLLLDAVLLPAWALTAVERSIRSNHAELALLVVNQSAPKRYPSLQTLWKDHNAWLYYIFNTIDEKLFLRGPSASARVNVSNVFSKVPTLQVAPINEDDKQYFSTADVEQIKSFRLDILVKMGFGQLQGDLLLAAKYGVWAYRWGDHRKIRDGLTAFWEVVQRWPETGAALQRLGRGDQPNQILFESWFFVYPYSPARARNYILWSASSFLPRQVERLYQLGGEKYFEELRDDAAGNPTSLKLNRTPSNLVTLGIMMKLVVRNLSEVFRRNFYREQWKLLFNFEPDAEKNISAFHKIVPPKDRFWADPHVVYKEPNYYIFIEEYPFATRRGHISVIEMDPRGNYQQPIPILQKDYHLSFPFVFDWQRHYYMIPESSENRTIDLYECVKFPDEWQYKMTLMKNVKAVDSTLFHINGKWWLFTAMAEQEEAAPQFELFLFYSEELFTGQWHAHPMNPIVSDVKRARAAGSIYAKEGKLFRPSQDCSKAYGYGFDLNEIVTLSENEYCERTVTSVRPEDPKNFIATHTFANQHNLTVIDALTCRPKWAESAE